MDLIVGVICAAAVAVVAGLVLDRFRGVSKRAEGKMVRTLEGIPDAGDRERWQEELRQQLLEYEGRPLKQYRESKELISAARQLVKVYFPSEPSLHRNSREAQLAASDLGGEASYRVPLPTKAVLKEALENLSYRERRVLELLYGLAGQPSKSHDEIGLAFNVTTERIKQIERQSLIKIQHLVEAQKLREIS